MAYLGVVLGMASGHCDAGMHMHVVIAYCIRSNHIISPRVISSHIIYVHISNTQTYLQIYIYTYTKHILYVCIRHVMCIHTYTYVDVCIKSEKMENVPLLTAVPSELCEVP